MSDLKVAATTEAVRIARTSPDGERRQRQPSPRQGSERRETSGAPRSQAT